jgi:hypothetical protein
MLIDNRTLLPTDPVNMISHIKQIAPVLEPKAGCKAVSCGNVRGRAKALLARQSKQHGSCSCQCRFQQGQEQLLQQLHAHDAASRQQEGRYARLL